MKNFPVKQFSRFLKSSSTFKTYDSSNHSLFEQLFIFSYNKDNFGYIINEPSKNRLIAFDFGEFNISYKTVVGLEKRLSANLTHLFTTHGHSDHCGGNKEWIAERPDLKVYSGNTENCDLIEATDRMNDLECVTIGDLTVACLFTPGHTKTAVTWVVTHVAENSTKIPFLFTGDTVFNGGCGRIFDGTHEEMYDSIRRISAFPNESIIFSGHEYTVNNLKFAQALEPDNEIIASKLEYCEKLRAEGDFTVGTKLIEEKCYNPFFRCSDPYFQELTGESEAVLVFKVLRKMKDKWN